VVWTVLTTLALLLASSSSFTHAFSLSTAVTCPAKTILLQRVPLHQFSTLSAWPILCDNADDNNKMVESPFLTWKRYKLQQAAQENPLWIDSSNTRRAGFITTPSCPPFLKRWTHPHPIQATASSTNTNALLASSVSGDDDKHDVSSSSSSSSSSSTTTTLSLLVEESNENYKPNNVRRFHSLVRETTSIATACLVAGVLVYCSANDQMLLVDALRFVCSCFTNLCDKGLLAVARKTAAASASSNVATSCVHALREVAMVCSAMSVTHNKSKNNHHHHRKPEEDNVSTTKASNNHPLSNTESESDHDDDDDDASLSWLARVKMATLHLLPAMNIVLSSASTLGKLQSWNELLYQALVTASSVDNYISPLEDNEYNDDSDNGDKDEPEPVQDMIGFWRL